MGKLSLRGQLCQFHKYILNSISNEYPEDHMRWPAVVFSPHFDDETLGCGGTVIKKKMAGADVKIVFMTDGSKSHRHLIAEDRLKTIRAKEALAVSRLLGLQDRDVIFLGFEETKLNEYADSATKKVTEVLFRTRPTEVFIPYHKEPLLWSEDHLSTNRIVASALQIFGRNTAVYEYPIWFWCHWPWTSISIGSPREIFNSFKNSFFSLFNSLRDFRCFVYIGDVLEHKRVALDHYKSQMTRLIPDSRWTTLGDLSNGEFLRCFFQEHEIFRKYRLTSSPQH